MNRKPTYRLSGAVGVALTGVVILAASLLAGCEPEQEHNPCPTGCVVPAPDASPASQAIPDCEDTAMYGPCTYLATAPDGQVHWYYVESGGKYPNLRTVDLGLWNPTIGTVAYVPLCPDVTDGRGPCVGRDGAQWTYVPTGGAWPTGEPITLCPTEDGGPSVCAWVPSAQGGGTGDSGAYVYGVTP